MGLVENLVQGFANATGDEKTSKRIDENKARRLAFADAYRKSQIDQFNTAKENIQKTLAAGQTLDPATQKLRPLTDDEVAKLHEASGKIDIHLQNLHDPDINPQTGMAPTSPIRSLTNALHITKPADTKSAGQQMQDIAAIQQKYGTVTPGTDEALAAQRKRAELDATIRQNRDLAKEFGLGDEDLEDITKHMLGVPATGLRDQWEKVGGTLDGKRVTLDHNKRTGKWHYPSGEEVPDEVANRFVMDKTGAGSRSRQAWGRDEKGYYSVALDPVTNQEVPESRNYNVLPPTSIVGRVSSGFHYLVDDNGNVHKIPETKTSVPNRPDVRTGAAPVAPTAATTPVAAPVNGTPTVKTPGEQKKDIAGIRDKYSKKGGGVPGDTIIGFKGTKLLQDSKQIYEDAIDRQKIMHENLKNALNGDQQAMLSLVANHIGMTLGAQKGARINQAVWNEAVASTPWLEKIKAKFDERGYLSGVTLAPEQMEQMVRLADEKVSNLYERLDRLYQQAGRPNPYGGSTNDDIEAIINTLNGKTTSGEK